MGRASGGYFWATRHPWPSLLFLLPLLLAYEAGILWLGGTHPEALRNGADTWLRWGLEELGVDAFYWSPILLVGVFLAWGLVCRADAPRQLLGTVLGMLVESVLFGLGLWGLSWGLAPLLDALGVRLSVSPPDKQWEHLITFVGAGIYEEVLFRLLLILTLSCLLQLADVPLFLAAVLVTVASALIFAAAHHLGPYGEAFNGYFFLFRAMAGCYFALLYQVRGFGIAVGTHVCYDVLVGVVLAPAS
jgi:hypothetical protein